MVRRCVACLSRFVPSPPSPSPTSRLTGGVASIRCTGPRLGGTEPQAPGAYCDDNWRLRRPSGSDAGALVLPEEPHLLALDATYGALFVGHLTVSANNQVQGGGVSAIDICHPETETSVRFAGLARTTFLPATLSQAVAGLSPVDHVDSSVRLYATARYSAAISGLALRDPMQPACTCPPDAPDCQEAVPGQERDLTMVPAETFLAPTFLPHGSEVRGIVLSTDGRTAFVLHSDDPAIPSNPAALAVLDRTLRADGTVANTPIAFLQVCSGPTAMRMQPTGRGDRLYVTCYDDGLIYVVDPVALVVTGIIEAGAGPTSLVFSPLRSGLRLRRQLRQQPLVRHRCRAGQPHGKPRGPPHRAAPRVRRMKGLAHLLLAAGLLAACSSTPTVIPTKNLDRPTDMGFVCLAMVTDAAGQSVLSGQPMDICHPRGAVDPTVVNDGQRTLGTFAFLPNAGRGELAVADLDRGRLLDLGPQSPGYGMLPISGAPEVLATSKDGCLVAMANRTSCDFTLVDPMRLLASTFSGNSSTVSPATEEGETARHLSGPDRCRSHRGRYARPSARSPFCPARHRCRRARPTPSIVPSPPSRGVTWWPCSISRTTPARRRSPVPTTYGPAASRMRGWSPSAPTTARPRPVPVRARTSRTAALPAWMGPQATTAVTSVAPRSRAAALRAAAGLAARRKSRVRGRAPRHRHHLVRH